MPLVNKPSNLTLLSEENIKNYVLPHYDIRYNSISQIKLKDTEKHRAVYKIQCEEQSYCLKKVYFDEKDLLFVYSVVEWFYRHDINVPRILATKNHSRYVKFNEMLFILTPWVDGIKCSYDSLEHIISSINNLAFMHKASIGFLPLLGSAERSNYSDIALSFNKHFQHLLFCSNLAFRHGDNFSKIFTSNFDDNFLLAKTSMQVSADINVNNLTKAICHLDYVNKNIIIDPENKVWVIDFDKCSVDYAAHDISYFFRRLLKRDNTKWDFELLVSCLNNYEKIYILTLDDYKYILAYLAFPQKFWKLSRDYYNNIRKCNHKAFISILNKIVIKNKYHLEFTYRFAKHIENKFKVKLC